MFTKYTGMLVADLYLFAMAVEEAFFEYGRFRQTIKASSGLIVSVDNWAVGVMSGTTLTLRSS